MFEINQQFIDSMQNVSGLALLAVAKSVPSGDKDSMNTTAASALLWGAASVVCSKHFGSAEKYRNPENIMIRLFSSGLTAMMAEVDLIKSENN